MSTKTNLDKVYSLESNNCKSKQVGVLLYLTIVSP